MEIKEKIKIGKKLWYRKNWWAVALMILFYGLGFVLFILFHNPFILIIFSFLWIFGLGFMNNRKMAYVEELVFDSGKSDKFFESALGKKSDYEEDNSDAIEAALLMKEMELSLGKEDEQLYEEDDTL